MNIFIKYMGYVDGIAKRIINPLGILKKKVNAGF
jgi:hypothetical protein